MKELQEIVSNKIQQMVNDNTIQSAIEGGIEKAVTSAISQQFQSYGNITKQLEAAIGAGLMIDRSQIDFETYNQQMLVAINQKVGSFFAEQASSRFMEEMDKILAPAPKQITITELVNTIAGFWREEAQTYPEGFADEATIEIVESYGSPSLKMWKKKEPASTFHSTPSPDVHLYLLRNRVAINHLHSFNLTTFCQHDAFIFKLYSAGTEITGLDEFDPDDCEVCLAEYAL